MEIQGYILHVKGSDDRYQHMQEQIRNLKIPFKYILDGDQCDLTAEIISKNFKDKLACVSGISSCTYKHFLSLRDMIKNNVPYGLIFENDVFLDKNFEAAVHKAISEIKASKQASSIKNFYLSLEDSFMKFVKGSARKKGQTVYKIERGEYGGYNGYNTRAAGAYIVDLEAAKNIIKEVDSNKCGLVSDWFYTYCVGEGIINLYYIHPTIVSQGSHNGKFNSLFPGVKRKGRLSYLLQKQYKKLLWRLR
ncbi:glycosyltransferase family 25 protein [Endomicrobium proavitum]|uniref:LPS biosynthesis glycosyltransferase n=1 Tax=Endomicrobium proavitum TaxID=1408281 RepID=A0A0G3WGE7_9BACT|nr:glycosyltransferase family 25 protein [Endomicrobium proavitum]AKL97438.1 LPS biosynthesis glycosyltransferase [Endomicrobium proavitum]